MLDDLRHLTHEEECGFLGFIQEIIAALLIAAGTLLFVVTVLSLA